MLCDNKHSRHTGKVVFVVLSTDDDGIYRVSTHSTRTNPQKHQRKKPSERLRLETEHQDTALSMFKTIFKEKQKAGFRVLKNDESITIPNLKTMFKAKLKAKKSKPKVKEVKLEETTYRKLAL